jgi:hypothetical protein
MVVARQGDALDRELVRAEALPLLEVKGGADVDRLDSILRPWDSTGATGPGRRS